MRRSKGGWRRVLTLFTLLQLLLALSTGISVVKLLQPRTALADNCTGACQSDADCPDGEECVCNKIQMWCGVFAK